MSTETPLAVHAAFDEIEEEFHAALEVSLEARGPESLFDLVAGLELAPGATAVDVGCGRGNQTLELARRFGLHVLGVDPVERIAAARLAGAQLAAPAWVGFTTGVAEALPLESESIDLVHCRESLMFTGLDAAVAEFRRVLRPGGRGLVYLVLRGPLMTDAEAEAFWAADSWGGLRSRALRPADVETALADAGLAVDERVDYGSEWGELAEQREGGPGRRLLFAARLLRQPDRYITQFGEENYNIMLSDCYWHVYRMLGKLSGYACVFSKN
jgi:SAM-dependent methyltransferase